VYTGNQTNHFSPNRLCAFRMLSYVIGDRSIAGD
jgi:hypothetical protein